MLQVAGNGFDGQFSAIEKYFNSFYQIIWSEDFLIETNKNVLP